MYNESIQKLLKPGKQEKSSQQKVLIPVPEQYFDSLPLDNSRVKLDSQHAPTIGCFTVLNSHNKMNCGDFTIDGSMLAIGLKDGQIHLHVMSKDFPEDISDELIKNLEDYKETHYSKMLKGGEVFYDMHSQAENDVSEEENAYDSIIRKRRFYVLNGHSEAVYALSFSPDNKYLVSASFDESLRLWSTITKTVVSVYKGHFSPVLTVRFSPLCNYFASGGGDRTAKLWSIGSTAPLRLLVGHTADVEVLEFHPNGLYLATAADDCTIRLWMLESGECVSTMKNISERSYVESLSFANSGKIMVAGCGCSVVLYDLIRVGNPIRIIRHFCASPVYSMCFDAEDSFLVVSTQDNDILFFDFDLLLNDLLGSDIDMNCYLDDSRFKYVFAYKTKKTPVVLMKFNHHNVLLTLGRFDDNNPKIFM